MIYFNLKVFFNFFVREEKIKLIIIIKKREYVKNVKNNLEIGGEGRVGNGGYKKGKVECKVVWLYVVYWNKFNKMSFVVYVIGGNCYFVLGRIFIFGNWKFVKVVYLFKISL